MTDMMPKLNFTNSFSTLGKEFYSSVKPTPFSSATQLIHFNSQAAELIDLSIGREISEKTLAEVFTGKQLLAGSDPLAMLYAGHQFGHWVSQLGDGRAILLGEVCNQKQQRWEIQLKGSGLTPYSRDGDGRAVLRSSIREYLCSEAMHALGIATTRSLCLVGSQDEVYREKIETGAMLTRLAPSHIRFGSFEVFYYRNQFEQVKKLADYVIDYHYTQFSQADNKYLLLLRAVISRTAKLIAAWQSFGFCHGVMNSDNMSILGLTLDYGPFAFMEAYNQGYICNHSDYHGRYAFDKQASIGLFNLSCLAQAMLPLFSVQPGVAAELAQKELDAYFNQFQTQYYTLMRAKLGLFHAFDDDIDLIDSLLKIMAENKVDYTIFLRHLCEYATDNTKLDELFVDQQAIKQWLMRYTLRLDQENGDHASRVKSMKLKNPKYILRNYMAEVAIRKAEDENDFSEVKRLFDLLARPFDEQADNNKYALPAPKWASQLSISCSS